MNAKLPRTLEVIRHGLESGIHIGAQLYVSLNRKVIAASPFGEARSGVPMRTDTLMLWLSCTKPLVAVAIAQQWEKGKLELDDRVTRFIPEFGQNGKEPVTIRQLLTHTCGFRTEIRWNADSWDVVLARICSARLEHGWIPGKKAGYHIASSWHILGEILRRLDGRSCEQYVRDEIFLPLGMKDSWLAMPVETYRNYGDRIGIMHSTEAGKPWPQNIENEVHATLCRPGGSGRGPIGELGCFYEALLARGFYGERASAPFSAGETPVPHILSPQTIEALTARHRTGMFDHTFSHVMDWGLGFIPNNNIYGAETVPYSYGRYASPRAFGHSGSQSSCAFADPEHGLVVAWVFNGMCGEERHNQRQREMNDAIYEDLGLA
jgi:CubicO group peptidase (beta-lactamase class C family)